MLDIKVIRENPEMVQKNTDARGANANISETVSLYEQLLSARKGKEQLQQEINSISRNFSILSGNEQTLAQEKGVKLKKQLADIDAKVKVLETSFNESMLQIPNLTAEEVPEGKTDVNNVPIKHFGDIPQFDFTPKDHIQLGNELNLIDFPAGAKVTGAKFYFLKNEAVLLEMALIRYGLDIARRHGFEIITTPELAKDDIISASGFTPRGPESQIYYVADSGMSLIGTSEITIGGYMANTVLSEKDMPLKISGFSHCFRTEAGSYGKESRGLYRVHQFSKVELYQFTTPENSTTAHEEMLAIEEEYYQSLGIPYRVMLMCKGDLGAPAYKKYDIEGWMPFQNDYGELTSTSNCTDFQARRLNIKFKSGSDKPRFVHTLNGTVVATTRTLLALLENNQRADGSILIPKVLHEYTGITSINPKL